MDRHSLTAILVGGLGMGLLSVVPLLQLGNCCCCMWAWGGGIVAAMAYARLSGRGTSAGRGVALGLVAGLVGALTYGILTAGLHASGLTNFEAGMENFRKGLDAIEVDQFVKDAPPDQQEEMRARLESLIARARELDPKTLMLYYVAGTSLVMLVLLPTFGFLGGLAGSMLVGGAAPEAVTPPPVPTGGDAGPSAEA